MQFRFNTPERSSLNQNTFEAEPSARRNNLSNQTQRYDGIIDYKTKAFELMQTVTELQIKDKESHRTIFYLQRELEMIHKDLADFLGQFKCDSLTEVKEKWSLMSEQLNSIINDKEKPLLKEEKITLEYEKILKEYKQILTTQQQKIVKYQNKWKLKQTSLTQQLELSQSQQKILAIKLEQTTENHQKDKQNLNIQFQQDIEHLKAEMLKEKQEIDKKLKQQDTKTKQSSRKLFEDNIQLKQDLQMLKGEFREILIQKQSIEEKHEKLKRKYKQEIQHFEMIEKEVEQKLIEVEKQITFYKEQRELNLDQIKKLQQENSYLKDSYSKNQLQEQFSFGGYFNMQTQTEAADIGINDNEVVMNAECYQISIKSLLEQNSRLKKTLILLEKTKNGEDLPPEAELQLKLLKGLSELSPSKPKKSQIQKNEEQSPTFSNLIAEQDKFEITGFQYHKSIQN